MPHTPPEPTVAHPTPRPLPWYTPPAIAGRSLAPDLARGFMLLLIACANVSWYLFGRETTVYSPHPTDGGALDHALRAVMAIAVDGRVYPMFAFLFGYGMVQFARARAGRGLPPQEIRRQLRRRHWFLLLFGFLHAALLFGGDILGAYGVTGLVLVAIFFNRSTRTLLTWAIVLLALVTVGSVAVVVLAWLLVGYVESDPAVAAEMAATDWTGGVELAMAADTNYLASIGTRLSMWAFATPAMLLTLTIPAVVLLGWAAARHGVLEQPERHRRLLTLTAAIGIPLGWLGGVLEALNHLDVVTWPAYAAWAPLAPAYAFGGFAGLGYAALFGLVALRVRTPGPALGAVAAVGRRSLSSYLFQSILFAPLLAAWGLGVGGLVNTAGALAIAVGVWLITVAAAVWMEARGHRGPFEVVLRRLTTGRTATT